MLVTAVWLFGFTALGGSILASFHLRRQRPPWTFTILHGLLAVSAVFTLIMAVAKETTVGNLHGNTALFLLVAGGGALVVSYHIRGRQPPVPLILAHGLAAVTAFILLLIYTLTIVTR